MSHAPATQNRLLHALPADETAAVDAVTEPCELVMGDVYFEAGTPIEDVVFPHSGVISLVADASEDAVLELALVGNDGVLGVALALGNTETSMGALVQASGQGSRIEGKAFAALLESAPVLRRRVLRYADELIRQLAQTVVCNSFHSAEQRTARWLLEMSDQAETNELRMTQAFIADMLGVRRPAISHAASALLEQGLISYSRGTVRLLDRSGLEKTSCRCYAVLRAIVASGA